MNILGIFWLNLRLEKARGPIAAAREEMRGTKLKGGGGGTRNPILEKSNFFRDTLTNMSQNIFAYYILHLFLFFRKKHLF